MIVFSDELLIPSVAQGFLSSVKTLLVLKTVGLNLSVKQCMFEQLKWKVFLNCLNHYQKIFNRYQSLSTTTATDEVLISSNDALLIIKYSTFSGNSHDCITKPMLIDDASLKECDTPPKLHYSFVTDTTCISSLHSMYRLAFVYIYWSIVSQGSTVVNY